MGGADRVADDGEQVRPHVVEVDLVTQPQPERVQCPRGVVTNTYAAARALAERGVVPGADLTAEAALAKLAYVLGKRLGSDETIAMLRRPLRGEMSA